MSNQSHTTKDEGANSKENFLVDENSTSVKTSLNSEQALINTFYDDDFTTFTINTSKSSDHSETSAGFDRVDATTSKPVSSFKAESSTSMIPLSRLLGDEDNKSVKLWNLPKTPSNRSSLKKPKPKVTGFAMSRLSLTENDVKAMEISKIRLSRTTEEIKASKHNELKLLALKIVGSSEGEHLKRVFITELETTQQLLKRSYLQTTIFCVGVLKVLSVNVYVILLVLLKYEEGDSFAAAVMRMLISVIFLQIMHGILMMFCAVYSRLTILKVCLLVGAVLTPYKVMIGYFGFAHYIKMDSSPGNLTIAVVFALFSVCSLALYGVDIAILHSYKQFIIDRCRVPHTRRILIVDKIMDDK